MLGMIFLAIEIIVFNKNFVDAVESIDSQTKKDIFISDYFLQSSGSLKIANLAMLWTNLYWFELFFL